jgi:hypothetical protein
MENIGIQKQIIPYNRRKKRRVGGGAPKRRHETVRGLISDRIGHI